MDIPMTKKLFDACFQAKRIIEMMPELPEKMKPRHIHVIDAIYENTREKGVTRVSDVSKRLNITTPSVTKLINELEERKAVVKLSVPDDKRITLLELTEKGESYYLKYVEEYHKHLAFLMKDFKDEECEIAIKIIENIYQIMRKERDKNGSR